MTFETIYRTHYDFIWRMLRRLGVSEHNMEDACQTVFLTAYRRIDDFEGRSSVKSWLCGIALRVASDYRRSAAIRHERLHEPSLDTVAAGQDLQQHVEQREQLQTLDRVLSQLNREQTTVLVLHEFEQFTGEEIAQLLQLPLGTVRSRLRLARQNFSRILAEYRFGTSKTAAGGES